jgi:hypothetical protein
MPAAAKKPTHAGTRTGLTWNKPDTLSSIQIVPHNSNPMANRFPEAAEEYVI